MKRSNVNWNLYRTFVAVYESRNLHRASESLGIAPPSVSQNIKELGNQLGVVLFIAHRKGVDPTPVADNLYPSIKQVIELINTAENNLEQFKEKSDTTVKIAVSNSVAEVYVRGYLRQFIKQHPEIRIEIFELENLNANKQKLMDLVIDIDRRIDPKEFLKCQYLFTAHSSFFASKGFLREHNLTAKMSLEQFLKLPLISRASVWKYFAKHLDLKTEPHIMKTASVHQTYNMTRDGLGAGHFAREYVLQLPDPNLVELNIDDIVFPTYNIIGAYSKPLSRIARTFLEGLVDFCKKK